MGLYVLSMTGVDKRRWILDHGAPCIGARHIGAKLDPALIWSNTPPGRVPVVYAEQRAFSNVYAVTDPAALMKLADMLRQSPLVTGVLVLYALPSDIIGFTTRSAVFKNDVRDLLGVDAGRFTSEAPHVETVERVIDAEVVHVEPKKEENND